jgi:hypothetical protein
VISKENQKQLALNLRRKGYSYSQIKEVAKVSKSSLSLWLRDMPLTKSQIDLLRAKNPQRIERFRNTMKLKREKVESDALIRFTKAFGRFSRREKILAGLFLYWGEGTKMAASTVALTNTDPDALRFFVRWLNLLGVPNEKMTVVLHLYIDMDIEKEKVFWSEYLKIPLFRFRNPYIKKTRLCDITYKSGFGHGTCSVLYLNAALHSYIKAGLRYIKMRA